MRAIGGEASARGVRIVNEVGVDPGVDHLLAMQCFDEIHTGGGKVMRQFPTNIGFLNLFK